MVRKRAKMLFRIGAIVWLVTFASVVLFKVTGVWPASWALVLFPVWGPPAFYVAYVVFIWAMVILLLAVSFVLGPWIRAWQK